jgi:hypothetical protein
MSFYEVRWKDNKKNPKNGGLIRVEHDNTEDAKKLVKRFIIASGISPLVTITKAEEITFINEDTVRSIENKRSSKMKI